MRIAVNASIVDPILSGLGVYTVNLIRELAGLHDDLVVYTSCPRVCDVSSSKIRSIRRNVQPLRGRHGHLQRFIWTQASLPLRLLADKAAILFSPLPEGMLFPVVRQVVVVHDVLPLHFPEEYPRQQHYFRSFVPMILRKSRAIVAVSESTKRDIVAFYRCEPSKVHVVPGGHDHRCYRTEIDTAMVKRKYGLEAYLLYVGNLLPHKNLRRLLHAFASISTTFPHTLVIAGRKDPRYYPALEAQAKALGLDARISFLDYVPSADLPALYAGAEVFLLPSLYEGFGLPILEAMACGTPVIASHAGSLPEVAGDAAILIDPYGIQDMASAMEAVLGDAGMRAAMRRRGPEHAERFRWGRTALGILEILQNSVLHP